MRRLNIGGGASYGCRRPSRHCHRCCRRRWRCCRCTKSDSRRAGCCGQHASSTCGGGPPRTSHAVHWLQCSRGALDCQRCRLCWGDRCPLHAAKLPQVAVVAVHVGHWNTAEARHPCVLSGSCGGDGGIQRGEPHCSWLRRAWHALQPTMLQ